MTPLMWIALLFLLLGAYLIGVWSGLRYADDVARDEIERDL